MINTLYKLAIIIALFALYTVECFPVPIHRALVIGLGEYEDSNWAKINGDNDVRYVVRMLEQMGYTDIKSLKNKDATKHEIMKAFDNLAKRCEPGDFVYIHYSGHGQLMTDLDGDESARWNGWHAQWDESLVPYDAYMTYCAKDRGEKHISDDELSTYLTKIRKALGKKGEIIVVLDACHSGDATRGELDEIVRGVDAKFNIPKEPNATLSNPIPEQWLTISACQPYQLCTEIKSKKVGKLTFALYSLGPAFFRLGRKDMERYLESILKKYEGRLPQNPMISGNKK
ncbi:MAG: caspase family protein [Muribaculum sp.]|nr:caspase family protein [Muribaculum sp.]